MAKFLYKIGTEFQAERRVFHVFTIFNGNLGLGFPGDKSMTILAILPVNVEG